MKTTKYTLIALTMLLCIGCSKSPPQKTISLDYFWEQMFSYTRANGWICWSAGLSGYEFRKDNCIFTIELEKGESPGRAKVIRVDYVDGDKASELFLQNILASVDGADEVLTVTHNN